jgi:hypothetical protein
LYEEHASCFVPLHDKLYTNLHLVLGFACLLPFHSWIKMQNFIDLGALKYIVILELGGEQ